jgi:hypothetical protein
MKERLLADLDARIARYANGDSSGVLDEQALAVVTELAASGDPDAGSLARVAALHLCRYQALLPEHGEVDRQLALAVYTNLHTVDPRLVPPEVRDLLGLASPHETGMALLREYERTGRVDHLERAISLLRQEVLEPQPDRADGMCGLGMAMLRRFERFGEPADLHEAIELSRGAVAAAARQDPRRAGFQSGLADGLLRRFELTAELADVDEAIALCREVVAATAGNPDHAKALSHLAVALSRRFKRTGQPADLDEAATPTQAARRSDREP